jgi:hypothetical protein
VSAAGAAYPAKALRNSDTKPATLTHRSTTILMSKIYRCRRIAIIYLR